MSKAVILFGNIIFERGKATVQKIDRVEVNYHGDNLEELGDQVLKDGKYDSFIILKEYKGQVIFIDDLDTHLLNADNISQSEREYIMDLWWEHHLPKGIDVHVLNVEHSEGVATYVATSLGEQNEQLIQWVRENWEQELDEELPDDFDKEPMMYVEDYFKSVPSESYIRAVEVLEIPGLYIVYRTAKEHPIDSATKLPSNDPVFTDTYEVVAGLKAARDKYNEFLNIDDTWTAGYSKMLESTDHDPNSKEL